jgi:uncharacterized membrane protein
MKKLIASLVVFAPVLVSAQTLQPITNANDLATRLTYIGNTIIGILIAFAVIYIVYMAVMFIVKQGSEDAAKYRSGVLWGIVGLAVILSIWGLVRILTNTFRTDNRVNPNQEFPVNPLPPQVR